MGYMTDSDDFARTAELTEYAEFGIVRLLRDSGAGQNSCPALRLEKSHATGPPGRAQSAAF